MNTDNPYQAPETANDGGDRKARRSSVRPTVVASGLLIFVGMCFLLLMNGQVFTNTLVFLSLCGVSALLWARLLLPSADRQHRRLACYVLLGHAVVIIAFAAGLRDKYQQQTNFNTRIERLRERLGLPPAEP